MEGIKNGKKPHIKVIPCSVSTEDNCYPGMIIGKNIYYKDKSTWWELNGKTRKKEKIEN